MTDTYNHLRTLLEGDKANKIPSAPSQDIAHELYLVYKSWTEMQALIENALRTGDYTNPLTVSQVAELSRQILKEMDITAYMYEALAKYAKPIVPGHYINVAGTQRKLFEKMSKEAALAAFGEDPSTNAGLMNETRAQFHRVHWELLKGSTAQASHRRAAAAPAADAPAADPIPRTTRVCLIQQMKNVSDHFETLEEAVLKVAAGSINEIEVLIVENPTTYVAMDDAVKMYTAFAAPEDLTGSEGDYVKDKRDEADKMCTAIMDSLHISNKERKETVVKSVQMQTLLEQAQAEYLLASATSLNSDKLQLESTVEDLQHWVDYFVYGKGKYHIPAPPSQELFDQMMELEASWDDLKPKFAIQSSRRLSAAEISNSSESMTSHADKALASYMTLAEEDEDLPLQRLYVASNQLKLLQKMTKEALLSRLRLSGAREDLSLTINEFEKAQDRLKNGGGGIQAIIPEREDLSALHGSVEDEWATFKTAVEEVADNDNADLVDMKTRLVTVSETVEESIPAYAELDPIVPPKPAPFPWHALVFAIMGCVVLIAIVSACCVAAKVCKGSNNSSKGKDLSSFGGNSNSDDSNSNQNAAQKQVQEQVATEEATMAV